MINLRPQGDGVLLPVRAHAGARTSAITGLQNGMLKVSVSQPPEKGKANRAVIEVVAEELGLCRSRIELVSGETSSEKRFLVSDMTATQLTALIERQLADKKNA